MWATGQECPTHTASSYGGNKKGDPIRVAFTLTAQLEPVQNSGVHADVVLVGHAVEAKRHPIQLDRAEDQLALAEVHAAAEQHGEAAIANASRRQVSAPEQSVGKWRELALMGRDHRPKCVGVHAFAGLVYAAEVASYAEVAGNIHVGSAVPAAGMPAAVEAGELIASVNFRLRCFRSHSQHRSHTNQYRNSNKFSHFLPLVNEIAPSVLIRHTAAGVRRTIRARESRGAGSCLVLSKCSTIWAGSTR